MKESNKCKNCYHYQRDEGNVRVARCNKLCAYIDFPGLECCHLWIRIDLPELDQILGLNS